MFWLSFAILIAVAFFYFFFAPFAMIIPTIFSLKSLCFVLLIVVGFVFSAK
tara:strand:- start:80 stop:232 length:153 start_codon:yes stop_codon:yes gene_type:complete